VQSGRTQGPRLYLHFTVPKGLASSTESDYTHDSEPQTQLLPLGLMIHLQGIVRTKFPLHSSKAKGKEGEKFQFPTDVEKQAVQP
jgi:hypothetical protein